jgi:ABC-2 type transport system ATP-binding protein
MSAITLRKVEKRFGPKQGLAGVDLELSEGSVLGFLGANGAGKTTTLRIVLGLLKPDSGEVRVLGRDPRREAAEVRAETGVMFDRDGHYDRLTARANLEFHAGVRRLDPAVARVRIDELLRAYGLWERQSDRVATFSKGMRQKLAVARAVLHRPKLLLLDEPFTGLDPAAAVELRDSLHRQASVDGVAILLTTHDLHHVEKLCDRIAVIESGKVVASGSPAELAAEPADAPQEVHVTGERLTEDVLAEMRKEGLIISSRLENGGALISCSRQQLKQLGRELVLRGVALQNLSAKTRSLEELFMNLVAPRGGAS